MSLDIEAQLRVFLASAPQTIRSIQTLQISHSAMSRVFHLWREPYAGTTFANGVAMAMLACNIGIKLASSEGNLDQKFLIKISTVDPQNSLRNELDRIPVATTEKILIAYREYLSDDLTAPQATANLQGEAISYIVGSAAFTAVSPRLNMLRTGEVYSPRDIPMLRGFL
jgi:hypothetical protein